MWSGKLLLVMVDYSQYGQALLLDQLITNDTPKVLVDVGANDGICGSNSRRLLEQGWYGVLVEPLPTLFAELQVNCCDLPSVRLLQSACSDVSGTSRLRIGRDGEYGQMSSLSSHPSIEGNLGELTTEVPTLTLADLFAAQSIPDDFGLLLVDTEGWDLQVLRGLESTICRPRIVVTEDFGPTNNSKYVLLEQYGYRRVATCASDSFWVNERQSEISLPIQFPISHLPSDWKPFGVCAGNGRVALDETASFENTLAGWAFHCENGPIEDVVVSFRGVHSQIASFFQAWRTPRRDVADVFHSNNLLMSGFRVHVDLCPATYEISVIQQGAGEFTSASAGQVTLPISH